MCNYCADCKRAQWKGYGFGWALSCTTANWVIKTTHGVWAPCGDVRAKVGINCPMYTPTLSRRIYAWWHGEKL